MSKVSADDTVFLGKPQSFQSEGSSLSGRDCTERTTGKYLNRKQSLTDMAVFLPNVSCGFIRHRGVILYRLTSSSWSAIRVGTYIELVQHNNLQHGIHTRLKLKRLFAYKETSNIKNCIKDTFIGKNFILVHAYFSVIGLYKETNRVFSKQKTCVQIFCLRKRTCKKERKKCKGLDVNFNVKRKKMDKTTIFVRFTDNY